MMVKKNPKPRKKRSLYSRIFGSVLNRNKTHEFLQSECDKIEKESQKGTEFAKLQDAILDTGLIKGYEFTEFASANTLDQIINNLRSDDEVFNKRLAQAIIY
ncbi:hypothetical protein KY312_00795, partial [Candidatus Woesearchaeota archaeon]|nr:hypothetical protein [Candidatus Woesearchaeota archaeon]